jgi:arylsulfatase
LPILDNRVRTGAVAATLGLLCLAAALGLTACKPVDPPPFNLLLISIDTLRADHLGYHGYPRATNPNLDRFAAANVSFRNFFTVSPKTGPAVTTMLSGKYVQNHGVTENPIAIPHGERLLPEILEDAVRTGAVVANPTLAPVRGYDAGFDDFVEVEGTDTVADRGLGWLEHNGDAPFFLWLHFLDPHGPYTPPRRLRGTFVGDAYFDETRPVSLDYSTRRGTNPQYILGSVPKYQQLGSIDLVDHYVAEYDAEILWVDEQIGRILDYVESSGLDRKTIVVLTADHGESLGEHEYYFEHGMLVNEGSIHVPLIISHPEFGEPRSIESLAQNTDLLPTLLALLNYEAPADIDGVDLTGLLRRGDAAGPVRDYVYACSAFPTEYEGFFETVRTREGKLVRSGEGELWYHDLQQDPLELRDARASLGPGVLEAWIAMLEGFGQDAVATDAPPALPEELRERLESLGYVQP